MAFPVRSGWVLVATLAAHSLASGQEQPTQPFDIVIRGGKIVDGTGNPWYSGDVAIRGDRIHAVGAVATETNARLVIDARGMVVAPGFIDIHSHSDITLLEDGSAESKIRQGVTTEVLGEDTSAGPAKGKQPPRTIKRGDVTLTWTTMGSYFDTLERQGIAVNVASYVGLGTLLDCARRRARPSGRRVPRPDERTPGRGHA